MAFIIFDNISIVASSCYRMTHSGIRRNKLALFKKSLQEMMKYLKNINLFAGSFQPYPYSSPDDCVEVCLQSCSSKSRSNKQRSLSSSNCSNGTRVGSCTETTVPGSYLSWTFRRVEPFFFFTWNKLCSLHNLVINHNKTFWITRVIKDDIKTVNYEV